MLDSTVKPKPHPKMRTIAVVVLAFFATVVFDSRDAGAQDMQPRHLSAMFGLFSYELADEGNAAMAAVRGSMPISSVLTLEGGIVGTRPDQVGRAAMFLAPEAQVQLALPFERFVPYMGLGLGAAIDFGGPQDVDGTSYDVAVSGSVGSRYWLNQRIGLQAEYRNRGIGFDFAGSSSEYTLGLAWRGQPAILE
jgi:hypothetical protein